MSLTRLNINFGNSNRQILPAVQVRSPASWLKKRKLTALLQTPEVEENLKLTVRINEKRTKPTGRTHGKRNSSGSLVKGVRLAGMERVPSDAEPKGLQVFGVPKDKHERERRPPACRTVEFTPECSITR